MMEQQFRRDIAASVEVVRRRRRAPAGLSRVMPTRLARRNAGKKPLRRRGRREFRARAVVAVQRLASGAFRSLFGPISVMLVILGLLSMGLPTVMGYVFGGLCLWFAVAAGLQAWRRRWPEGK
jgi:hypothetical protein